jgi:Ni,Fe-hydrogenase maturation factor
MNVYVFGNEDYAEDNTVFKVINKLGKTINGLQFIYVKPNEDLPFVGEKNVVILDTVQGINKVEIINEQDLDKLIVNRSTTAHDYDLGFQLKYLKKLGKIEKITIIGLPQNGKIDYDFIQSILRKFVAQDMQGS